MQRSVIGDASAFMLGVELVPPRGVSRLFEAFLAQNDVFFSEETFSVECLVDRVKLLSWKWFLGKNHGSSVPFTSGVFTLLYSETGKVCWGCRVGSRWVRGIGGPLPLSYLWLIPVSLSLLEWYFSSRGGVFEGL
ncbi:hypothetical protein A2U01_0013823 [Trifolium medium]|uniref:Uncharacterized protein n=1 Tax=Trifolium medium TaxID=97028 RepID=A0A392MZA9_9FABA|nr:hypothetical protein [Trifolium medium]